MEVVLTPVRWSSYAGQKQNVVRRWVAKWLGTCCNNTNTASIWSQLKTELFDGGNFPNLAESRWEVRHYTCYHNAERRHSALGF
ncbi:IS3 family transposase [Hymenobacter bucti]|uniref:IS3 family transposase n=1 Tax=Hymenobacter bucti TaxID=1844114 RepID=A0ABW4R300_9BACT